MPARFRKRGGSGTHPWVLDNRPASFRSWLFPWPWRPAAWRKSRRRRGAGPGEEEVPGRGQQAAVCEPASGALPSGATLAGKAGSYRLTLVEVAGGRDARRGNGTLTLRPQPPGLDSLGIAGTPLYGFTDVDPRAVGAHRVGDPAGEDPKAPGVLVLESESGEKRRILLRLGADANRRDGALFDGAWTVLEVREIAAEGFAGSWRSGLRLSRTGGYFCAKKVP